MGGRVAHSSTCRLFSLLPLCASAAFTLPAVIPSCVVTAVVQLPHQAAWPAMRVPWGILRWAPKLVAAW